MLRLYSIHLFIRFSLCLPLVVSHSSLYPFVENGMRPLVSTHLTCKLRLNACGVFAQHHPMSESNIFEGAMQTLWAGACRIYWR